MHAKSPLNKLLLLQPGNANRHEQYASKIEIVECLLKSGGCEVNAQTKGSKATALHRACMKGRPEIVQLLLSKLLPLV